MEAAFLYFYTDRMVSPWRCAIRGASHSSIRHALLGIRDDNHKSETALTAAQPVIHP